MPALVLWAARQAGYRSAVRRAHFIAVVIVCTAAVGCSGDDAPRHPGESAPPVVTGEPLELNDTSAATARTCVQCTQAAGPAHLCGRSVWCATCRADAAATAGVHRCNVSHFCKGCGHEAAIAGHRCGESAFDPASLSDVDWEDLIDEEGDDE